MRADSLTRQIFVCNDLIGRRLKETGGVQSVPEPFQPWRQGPDIGIVCDRARTIIITIAKMLYAAFEFDTPVQRIKRMNQSRFLVRPDECRQENGFRRQIF